MAKTTYQSRNARVTLKPGGIAKVVGPMADQAAYRAAQKLRGRAMSNIRRLGRVNTGNMLKSLQVRRLNPGPGTLARYSVSSTAFYARFQEEGTRAHGPVRAKFLRFKPKGSSTYVFAKWVRGVKPGYFMRDAARAAKAEDFLP